MIEKWKDRERKREEEERKKKRKGGEEGEWGEDEEWGTGGGAVRGARRGGQGTYMLVFRNEQQKDTYINSLKAIG